MRAAWRVLNASVRLPVQRGMGEAEEGDDGCDGEAGPAYKKVRGDEGSKPQETTRDCDATGEGRGRRAAAKSAAGMW